MISGPHGDTSRGGDEQPGTVFRGEPAVVLGLASGMLTVEQAVAAGGSVRGRAADLTAVFGPADLG